MMISLSNRIYLSEDYWKWVKSRRSEEQVARELSYLRAALNEKSPGRRVAVLGYGVGYYAIGLRQAGFEVTALDSSQFGVSEAYLAVTSANIDVKWEAIDAASGNLPLFEVDAVVCVDWLGVGTDADHRRLLRTARSRLATNGLLIVLHSDVLRDVSSPADPVQETVGDKSYRFKQTYNPISGRCHEELEVYGLEGVEQILEYDRRVYSTVELAALVRSAGFLLGRVDADFGAGNAPGAESRYVQINAHPLRTPPVSLAVASWRTPPDERLELRYASDEAPWLRPDPADVWKSLLASEADQGLDAIGHYPVDDPYGGERGAEAISAYFGCSIAEHQLTFASGVTSLLHDLYQLADGGLIVEPILVHPDLSAWAASKGVEVRLVDGPETAERLIEEIHARHPSLVHFDRPNFNAELISHDDLYVLCTEAVKVGAIVLIDESPSTYLGPQASAVQVVNRVENLVVLKSLTKAYSWGGQRVGYAVASEGVSARVRELVSPLQVSELAFRALLLLLKHGDIFRDLRARIRVNKPITVDLLKLHGLEVIEGHPDIPWVVVPDGGGKTSEYLSRLGIRGLSFAPSPAQLGPLPELLHLTVPISDERLAALRRLLGSKSYNRDYRATFNTTSTPVTAGGSTQLEYRACLTHWRYI